MNILKHMCIKKNICSTYVVISSLPQNTKVKELWRQHLNRASKPTVFLVIFIIKFKLPVNL